MIVVLQINVKTHNFDSAAMSIVSSTRPNVGKESAIKVRSKKCCSA